VKTSLLGFVAAAGAVLVGVSSALAQETIGAPVEWQWGFQEAQSPIMERIYSFYDWALFPMMIVISAFVLALMAYILFRFKRSSNPEASTNTHNTTLEVVWTVVPILILVGIAIPSLRLLYYEETIPEADITIKAVGYQWSWYYEYPDHGGIEVDGSYVPEDQLEPGQLRLLTTAEAVVLPVGQVIRVQLTSEDVIHAWALPAAGAKMDAVPGRLNEFWIELNTEGMYYGQCSELCGQLHGFMPIMVEAVSPEEFEAWVNEQQVAQGKVPADKVELAANDQN